MANRNSDMQAVFNQLSEKNKDIVILVAKGIKIAQEESEKTRKSPKQTV